MAGRSKNEKRENAIHLTGKKLFPPFHSSLRLCTQTRQLKRVESGIEKAARRKCTQAEYNETDHSRIALTLCLVRGPRRSGLLFHAFSPKPERRITLVLLFFRRKQRFVRGEKYCAMLSPNIFSRRSLNAGSDRQEYNAAHFHSRQSDNEEFPSSTFPPKNNHHHLASPYAKR